MSWCLPDLKVVIECIIICVFQVKELLATDDFKPNSAMVVLDFLIRHSLVEPDTGLWRSSVRGSAGDGRDQSVDAFLFLSEPHYQEFVAGLHQTL